MFKQAGVGIAIVDLNGRIARANKRMADIIGRSPEETVGLLCESITHPDDWAANKESMRQVLSGSLPDFAVDARHLCPDKRVVWTHVSMSPLLDTDGTSEGLIVVVEDVSERRESEEALRLADRQKDDFLALLSHELRNPLAPIRTAVQLLQMRGNLDDDGRRLHGVIERQVQHLVRLVDDLLDVSRILRDKVALRPDRSRLPTSSPSRWKRRGRSSTRSGRSSPVSRLRRPCACTAIRCGWRRRLATS